MGMRGRSTPNTMTNFVHRMSFKKTKGFSPVALLTLAEGA